MTPGSDRACSSPVALYLPSCVAWAVVHGDDLVFTGTDVDLDFILMELTSMYEIKNRERLGNGPTDVQNIDVGTHGATAILVNFVGSRCETSELDRLD